MTGIRLRVEREGRMQYVEVEHLTAAEWEMYVLAGKTPKDGWRWAWMLAQWIHHNVEEAHGAAPEEAMAQACTEVEIGAVLLTPLTGQVRLTIDAQQSQTTWSVHGARMAAAWLMRWGAMQDGRDSNGL